MADDATTTVRNTDISDLTLLRVVLLKEVRTTFRERSQVAGLLVSVVMLIIAIGGFYRSAHRHRPAHTVAPATPATMSADARPSTQPSHTTATPPPAQPTLAGTLVLNSEERVRVTHWASIAGAALIGIFFSMGYLIAAVLASFVGEKEARTLEVLLASPLSDGKLYLFKCAGVLLPSVVIGCFFAVVVALMAAAFIPAEILPLPATTLIRDAVLLGIPLMLLPQLWLVGLGSAISIRAETVKGASQILGVAVMILIFGGIYGVPVLLATVPSVRPPAIALLHWWIDLSFASQYGMLLVVLGVPAAGLVTLGRACFRRDRMLT
jgi:ABC-type transport system involved in multi-copper enzyme maturation permease subunit